MKLPALSMLVFGALIVGMGMTGLMNPQFLLNLLDISAMGASILGTQIFVMACSQASLAMGLYYMLSAVNETQAFFHWSVPLRIMNFMVFAGMVILGIAPPKWLMVAALEIAGALATALALASKNNFSLDRCRCLQIASVGLALLGACLAFQPFGIYGSASAFLAVFSIGFIYAYRKSPPDQAGIS
jgi:hypothetical protein